MRINLTDDAENTEFEGDFYDEMVVQFAEEYRSELGNIYEYLENMKGLKQFVKYLKSKGYKTAKAYRLKRNKDGYTPSYGITIDNDDEKLVEYKLKCDEI